MSRYFVNHGDAVLWLSKQQAEICDLFIMDIAYASLEKHRKVGTTTRLKKSKSSSNEWFPIFVNERIPSLLEQAYRVAKKDTHFYFMCDVETSYVVKPMFDEAGFRHCNDLTWNKMRIGMGWRYRKQTERVMMFEKGSRQVNNRGISDLLSFQRVDNGYPTEKPVELAEVFVQMSTEPGNLVIDPMMGSGTFGVAALKNKRNFWGNDVKLSAVRLAESRFEKIARAY